MIKSSVYINKEKLSLLENFSDNNGFSVNEIVTLLLQKILKDGNCTIRKFIAVKYQDDDPDNNWETLTVNFKEVDYELFTDMRKFFKLSVSLLLAKAIDLFLDSLLSEIGEILLNYSDSEWNIRMSDLETGVIWTIFWIKTKQHMRK